MSKDSDCPLIFGIGVLLGVAAGVAAGVLFAPKPGSEVREDLKLIGTKYTNNAFSDITSTKIVSTDILNKLKLTLEKQIAKINEAIKAGKMAAAKQKEELNSGFNY